MKKVFFYTLGCKLNFSETAIMQQKVLKDNNQVVNSIEEADVIVMNTCSVTENADIKCKKLIRKTKKINPTIKIIVTGCYAQLKPKEIAEIKDVTIVLGNTEKFELSRYLDSLNDNYQSIIKTSDISKTSKFNFSYSITERTRSFLKIQEGCNYHCSFCTIPIARGRSRSPEIQEIIAKAKEISKRGVEEIILTGINIGDYGIIESKRRYKLIDLLYELNTLDNIQRFRISSIEPNLITTDIVDFIACSKKFMPHFHIPLQSGSDKILQKMRRRYNTKNYRSTINYIMQKIPSCSIGVDIMTGFPEETEKDFIDTYQFLVDLPISYLHVFPYSQRDNTDASLLVDNSKVVKNTRATMLRNLSDKKKGLFYTKHIGEKAKVLIEGSVKEDRLYGYTENYIRTTHPYNKDIVNTIQQVQLHSFDSNKFLMNTESL